MTNALFGLGREAFLAGDAAWDSDNINVLLYDTALGVPNIDTAQYVDPALTAGDIIADYQADSASYLGTKTVTLGVADAADITFTAITGDPFEAIIIIKDTGVATTDRLLVYIDTATGLPCTPNGGDITITWDSGANKIFKL